MYEKYMDVNIGISIKNKNKLKKIYCYSLWRLAIFIMLTCLSYRI